MRRNLVIEATDINLNRQWGVVIEAFKEYETGIVASENYIFVTGRIWE